MKLGECWQLVPALHEKVHALWESWNFTTLNHASLVLLEFLVASQCSSSVSSWLTGKWARWRKGFDGQPGSFLPQQGRPTECSKSSYPDAMKGCWLIGTTKSGSIMPQRFWRNLVLVSTVLASYAAGSCIEANRNAFCGVRVLKEADRKRLRKPWRGVLCGIIKYLVMVCRSSVSWCHYPSVKKWNVLIGVYKLEYWSKSRWCCFFYANLYMSVGLFIPRSI